MPFAYIFVRNTLQVSVIAVSALSASAVGASERGHGFGELQMSYTKMTSENQKNINLENKNEKIRVGWHTEEGSGEVRESWIEVGAWGATWFICC